MYTTLIAPAQLQPSLGDPDWAVVDCRFSLAAPSRGRAVYQAGHIPGAVYAHLDVDLSGPVLPGQTGRHPLPDVATFARTLGQWGIGEGVQVVAYDDAGGAIAARLWWMLRWVGHDAVAVLDGGFPRWEREGYPARSGAEGRPPRVFVPQPRSEWVVTAADVAAVRQDPAWRVLDARAAARYRGEVEPIDPVAGHIPGACSVPFAENLDAEGCFLPVEQLRERFEAVLEGTPPEQVICYCGSGVTAAHDLLALAYAGLGEGRLYAGSWSHWITDPERPVG